MTSHTAAQRRYHAALALIHAGDLLRLLAQAGMATASDKAHYTAAVTEWEATAAPADVFEWAIADLRREGILVATPLADGYALAGSTH